jgi:hypothetical protein
MHDTYKRYYSRKARVLLYLFGDRDLFYGLVYFHPKSKIFSRFSARQIFRRIYGVLNINEIKN